MRAGNQSFPRLPRKEGQRGPRGAEEHLRGPFRVKGSVRAGEGAEPRRPRCPPRAPSLRPAQRRCSLFPPWRRADLSLHGNWIFFNSFAWQTFFPRLIGIYEPRPWGQRPNCELSSCCSHTEQGASVSALRLHLPTCIIGAQQTRQLRGLW